LTADELQVAFQRLSISLRPEEISLLLIEYDPSGAARSLDLKELEADFSEWRSKEY